MDGDEVRTLAARVGLLEDRAAILQLKAFYAKCADDKYTDDHRRKPQQEIDAITRRQVTAVFTEDAVWDGGVQFGKLEGREAIYQSLRLGAWSFAMHYFVNPVIELRGDEATGDWMLWQPCTFEQQDVAVFMSAVTHDAYVRTGAGWRMSRMNFTLKFITRFDRPWSIDRNAPLAV